MGWFSSNKPDTAELDALKLESINDKLEIAVIALQLENKDQVIDMINQHRLVKALDNTLSEVMEKKDLCNLKDGVLSEYDSQLSDIKLLRYTK